MKNFILLVAFTLLFSGYSLFAQTQTEMNEKAYKDYQKADSEMNKVYQQLIKILSKEDKKMLVTAQKNWLKFRDSHCKFESEQYNGGSIQPLILSTCLSEQTEKRIADLKATIKNRNF